MLGKAIVASVKAVYPERGNRVYELQFMENKPPEVYGRVVLDLSEHPDERRIFHDVSDEYLVEVETHKCPDLVRTDTKDVFYVWQPRLTRTPVSCPRCKYRLYSTKFKRGMGGAPR